MIATQRSSEGLTERQRRILFRCWHRGMREVDLLLGQFANVMIDRLSPEQLDELEAFMEAQDADIFSWFAGSRPPPQEFNLPIFIAMRQFHHHAGPLNL